MTMNYEVSPQEATSIVTYLAGAMSRWEAKHGKIRPAGELERARAAAARLPRGPVRSEAQARALEEKINREARQRREADA